MNRSTGAVFALPLIGIGLFAILSFDAPWRGEWNWTFDAITGSSVLTGPLTASAAAHIAISQRRLVPLVEPMARGWMVPFRAGVRAWLWGLGAYALTAGVATLATILTPHGGRASVWVLAIGPVLLACCAMAGTALGWLWPHRLAPVLAAPAVFLLGTFGPRPLPALLRHGPVTGSLAGLEYVPWVWWAQLGGLLGLTGLAAGALLRWQVPAVRSRALGLVVISAALLVTTSVPLVSRDSSRFASSDERPTACAGARPRTCLAPSNTRYLAPTASAIDQAAQVLEGIGVDVPATYEQLLPGYRPPVESGMLTAIDDADASLRRGASLIATPAACTAWTDREAPPPEVAYEAQGLISAWIMASKGLSGDPWSEEVRGWLADPAAPDRVAWMRAAFGHLRACRFSRLTLPWD